ncbi:MAG: terminase large subunit, partial [Nitrospira sp.]|nr:terminase large subunit [Nitrospira sp.]
RKVISDPSTYGVVWAAHPQADPFKEETWMSANPGYGVSPSREFLSSEAKKAKQSPANLARFLRLHLGIRTKQTTKYIDLDSWRASAGSIDESALEGRFCFGGMDLSATSDITAVCWTFPDRAYDKYEAIWRFWLPEAKLEDLNRRTAGQAEVWVRDGLLKLTSGNVIDNDEILYTIDQDAQKFNVRTIGYDRWMASDVVRRLTDNGLQCVGVQQSIAALNPATKEMLRLVLSKKYIHGGNPIMLWMIDNLSVEMDSSGRVKPNKTRAADKIDGVVAALMSLSECMNGKELESPGVLVW